ncbi:MAG: NERD domain-containing protein [Nitrososphaerota archaeon]|jgi:hypothetical protein|nr:NERD domain-containing protein [Nitrososphaerota archaeon]
MRKISENSHYLRNQSWKYLGWTVVFLLLFVILFGLTGYTVLFKTRNIGGREGIGFVGALILLASSWFYQRKYHIYKGGWQGEKTVVNTLTKNLGNEYYLINGAYIRGDRGDVDHILLGPSGVYVLETKNWRGKITCYGDQWLRSGKKIKNSPSLQIKRNTQKIIHLVGNAPTLRDIHIWVEGLLVFTNPNTDLNINNPTVTTLKLAKLSEYIKKQPNNRLTKEQIQQIIKQIQNI